MSAGGHLRDPTRAPVTFGLFGVLLAFLSMGLLHAHGMARFQGADEVRHVAYALVLMEGRRPHMSEPLDLVRLDSPPRTDSNLMAAANHPPLYYWIVGPALTAGYDAGRPDLAVRVARWLTLAMGAGALVAMWRVASALVPGRPAVALVAVALVGSLPAFLNTSALAYNDALHVLTTVALTDVAVRLWLFGVQQRRIVAFVVWCSLAMLTRLSAILVLAPMATLAAFAVARHVEGGPGRRAGAALGLVAGVGAAVLLTSGWFYLHNVELYGDVSGASTALADFQRTAKGSLLFVAGDPRRWERLTLDFWTRLAGGVYLRGPEQTVTITLVVVSVVLWAGWAVRLVRARRRALFGEPQAVAVAHLFAAALLVLAAMFQFYAQGGLLNQRYFFAMVWLPALMAAVGYASTAWRPAPVVAVIVGYSLTFYVGCAYVERLVEVPAGAALARGLAAGGVPTPAIVALAAFAAGVSLVAIAVRRLHAVGAEPPTA